VISRSDGLADVMVQSTDIPIDLFCALLSTYRNFRPTGLVLDQLIVEALQEANSGSVMAEKV